MASNDLFGTEKINVSKSLLKNQAYELIKTAIINNRIKPDTIYSQGFLSENLGISRTPVREALLQLQGEGLIHIFRGRGIQVITTTQKDLQDLLEMSEAIECKICQMTAERIDDSTLSLLEDIYKSQEEDANDKKITEFMQKDREFHYALAKTTGNKKFAESVEIIHEQLLRSGIFLIYQPECLPVIIKEHRKILDALHAHSASAAIEAMFQHIQGIFARAMESSSIMHKQ